MDRFGGDAVGLAADLERAGIDTRGFGVFAHPHQWLPLVETADLKEVIARGMTDEPSAAGEGTRGLS
jgi:hypothetical protein